MNSQDIKRYRICFMNSNKVWGGGEKWHYETACYLDQLGYSVMVITNKESDLYQKLKEHPSIILKFRQISNFSFLNPFKLIYLRKLLRANKIQTIILGLSIDVKLGGVAAKMASTENIIYRRGSALPVRNSFINRYLFHKVLTKIITNSYEIKTNIFQKNSKIIDENKVQIVYNGIDLENWPPLDYFKNNSNDVLTLGNAGRLVAQKGQGFLIKIARELKERNIAFKMYIAGSGELEKSLKKDCMNSNLGKEIIFLDFVEDMYEFLKGLDIYLSTSLHEGSSHVIIEAMGAGKPVVAFDISSMPELVISGETGYLIPFGDTKDFAEKVIELNNHPKILESMGFKARAYVEKKFNFRKNIQEVLDLIDN